MRMVIRNSIFPACLLFAQAPALANPMDGFSSGGLADWQEQQFQGRTDYALVALDGRTVLRAQSNGSASGLYRELQVDLHKTPYLNWSWRVENILAGPDEATKAGDDYPARIYVVISGGLAFWRTRTVSYVWASRKTAGASWPNAFTDNAQMLAVRSGTDGVGEWQWESRNVETTTHHYNCLFVYDFNLFEQFGKSIF